MSHADDESPQRRATPYDSFAQVVSLAVVGVLVLGGFFAISRGVAALATDASMGAAALVLGGAVQLVCTVGLWQRKSWGFAGITLLYLFVLPVALLSGRPLLGGSTAVLLTVLLSQWRSFH